jgi:hypothetical protein
MLQQQERIANKAAAPATGFWWVKWVFAACMLASLLFAHGCHGDEDHELFTAAYGAAYGLALGDE